MPTIEPEVRFLATQFAELLRNPKRLAVFHVISERQASAKELADELGGTIKAMSRLIDSLVALGLAELVDTKTGGSRRGGAERFYRAFGRPYFNDEEWDELTPSERQPISAWMFSLVIIDAADAIATGTFDSRTRRHLSRVPMRVGDQGFDDIADLLSETLAKVLDIQVESAERLAKADEDGFWVSTALTCFPRPWGPKAHWSDTAQPPE